MMDEYRLYNFNANYLKDLDKKRKEILQRLSDVFDCCQVRQEASAAGIAMKFIDHYIESAIFAK